MDLPDTSLDVWNPKAPLPGDISVRILEYELPWSLVESLLEDAKTRGSDSLALVRHIRYIKDYPWDVLKVTHARLMPELRMVRRALGRVTLVLEPHYIGFPNKFPQHYRYIELQVPTDEAVSPPLVKCLRFFDSFEFLWVQGDEMDMSIKPSDPRGPAISLTESNPEVLSSAVIDALRDLDISVIEDYIGEEDVVTLMAAPLQIKYYFTSNYPPREINNIPSLTTLEGHSFPRDLDFDEEYPNITTFVYEQEEYIETDIVELPTGELAWPALDNFLTKLPNLQVIKYFTHLPVPELPPVAPIRRPIDAGLLDDADDMPETAEMALAYFIGLRTRGYRVIINGRG